MSTGLMNYKIGVNNFDLIRLFAASQVAVLHVASYLSPSWNATWIGRVLECFPGVPTFFFISGFLISRSYEKNSALADYTRNRALRIFPALHVCVAANLVLIAMTGYFATVHAGVGDIAALYLAKTTILQFYNPDFMRSFGDGVLNGSLWTICVELQFYFLTPLLYRLFLTGQRRRDTFIILAILGVSLVCNRLLYALQPQYADENWWKVFRVSFLPWFYMFLCGVLMQKNFDFFARLLSRNSLLIVLPLYLGFALLMQQFGARMDNGFSPVLFFPLIITIFVAAFSATSAAKALHGNDISYGLYIYHVPVMNMFLFYGLLGSGYTVITLAISLLLAALSWVLIERPCLRRKRSPAHPAATGPVLAAAPSAAAPATATAPDDGARS